MKALFPALILLGTASLSAWAQENIPPDFKHDAAAVLRRQPHLIQYVRQNFQVQSTGIARIPGHDTVPPQPPFIFKARPRGSDGPFYITLLIQPGPPGHILKVVDPTQPGGRPPGVAGPTYLPPSQAPFTGGGPPAGNEEPMSQAPVPDVPRSDAPYTGGSQPAPFSPSGSPDTAAPAASSPAPEPAETPAQPAAPPSDAGSGPSGPTADTPSGPIRSTGQGTTTLPPAPTNSPTLSPPPDPAPANQ